MCTLTEIIQGPCRGNQEDLTEASLGIVIQRQLEFLGAFFFQAKNVLGDKEFTFWGNSKQSLELLARCAANNL